MQGQRLPSTVRGSGARKHGSKGADAPAPLVRIAMWCKCGGKTRVTDSRLSCNGQMIRRRRKCLVCDARVTTQEWVVNDGPQLGYCVAVRSAVRERIDDGEHQCDIAKRAGVDATSLSGLLHGKEFGLRWLDRVGYAVGLNVRDWLPAMLAKHAAEVAEVAEDGKVGETRESSPKREGIVAKLLGRWRSGDAEVKET